MIICLFFLVSDGRLSGYLCKPLNRGQRYLNCVLVLLIFFIVNLIVNVPLSLEEVINRELNISTDEFSLFFQVMRYPSMVVCPFVGIALDLWGLWHIWLIIFTSMVTLGHFVFTLGLNFVSFPAALVGRILCSFSFEPVCLCAVYLAKQQLQSSELGSFFGSLTFLQV